MSWLPGSAQRHDHPRQSQAGLSWQLVLGRREAAKAASLMPGSNVKCHYRYYYYYYRFH